MDNINVYSALQDLQLSAERYMRNNITDSNITDEAGSNGWIIKYIFSSKRAVYQRDLEKEFGINRSSASKSVDALVERGLVIREHIPEDGRLKKLTLTEKGQKIAEQFAARENCADKALTNGFSINDKKLLASLIGRMKINLSK